MNGQVLAIDEGELVALVLDTAEGQVDVPAIAGILKGRTFEIPDPPEDKD